MIVLGAPHVGFVGGVERHVFDLARGLRARVHRVALVHGPGEGRDATRYASAFDDTAPAHGARTLVSSASAVYLHKLDDDELLDAARVPPVVAVHDHDPTCVRKHRYLPLGNAPCVRAPGVSCVLHGCVVVRQRDGRLPIALRDPFALGRATRALASRAHLVACSEFVRSTLVGAGVSPSRVTVVHPVPPYDDAELVPAPAEPVIAFVGQVIRGKGLDILLEAMTELPAFRLLVAGTGSALDAEKARAHDLGVAPRVEFLGQLAPERVREVYDRARVLAVPSRWPEPFGMIGVEAMRRGRVVVGARHGGIPEWLDDGVNGFAFRPGDPRDLARALRRAATARDYDALAAAGMARAKGELGFDAMLDAVERVLHVGARA